MSFFCKIGLHKYEKKLVGMCYWAFKCKRNGCDKQKGIVYKITRRD